MKKHVVKYPSTIRKSLLTMGNMKKHKAYSIISKAGLPEGTLFDWFSSFDHEEFGHSSFTILLTTGEAFTGFAIKKSSDDDDPEKASCIAAGRAVAVWRSYQGGQREELLNCPHKTFGEYCTYETLVGHCILHLKK